MGFLGRDTSWALRTPQTHTHSWHTVRGGRTVRGGVHGIPAAGIIPEIPPSIPQLYISPECEIDPNATHFCADGSIPSYNRMTMRWGIIKPEEFTITEQVLVEIGRDLIPFANLSNGALETRSSLDSATDEQPITWVISTGIS